MAFKKTLGRNLGETLGTSIGAGVGCLIAVGVFVVGILALDWVLTVVNSDPPRAEPAVGTVPATAPAAAPAPPPIDEVDAPTLVGLYGENEAAANRRFRGQPVRVAGIVDEVEEDDGRITVSLKGGHMFRSVHCRVIAADRDEALRLDENLAVVVVGTGNGTTTMGSPQLSECRIEQPEQAR